MGLSERPLLWHALHCIDSYLGVSVEPRALSQRELEEQEASAGAGGGEEEEESDEATLKAREWDNWKDENPRGMGNTMGK